MRHLAEILKVAVRKKSIAEGYDGMEDKGLRFDFLPSVHNILSIATTTFIISTFVLFTVSARGGGGAEDIFTFVLLECAL